MRKNIAYFVLSFFVIVLQTACPTNRLDDMRPRTRVIRPNSTTKPSPTTSEPDPATIEPQDEEGLPPDMPPPLSGSVNSRYSDYVKGGREHVGDDDGRVSLYYETTDGLPLYQQPYVQPTAKYVGFGSPVTCLGKASNYFLNDDEVNQFFVNIASKTTSEMHFYRWEERKFGSLRVKGTRADGLPIFLPLGPLPPGTSSYQMADLIPDGFENMLLPNGSGATAYGFGLYTASTPFGSIIYGDAIYTKGTGEIFLLEVTVPAGVLLLADNALVPNEPTLTVSQAMQVVGLGAQDIYNCNPPLIYDILGGWLVLKDPSHLEAEEFTGKHIDADTLRRDLRANAGYGASAARNAVIAYLRQRIKIDKPDFDG